MRRKEKTGAESPGLTAWLCHGAVGLGGQALETLPFLTERSKVTTVSQSKPRIRSQAQISETE